MTICPYCDASNIEGSDRCEQCGQGLADLHLSSPGTHVERALLADRVAKLTPKSPIAVAPNMAIGEVIQLLVDKGIGCVFVVESDRLVGVFSERDAVNRLGADASKVADKPVSEFMTPNPDGLDANAKIAFAVRMMDLGGFRHIPVVDEKGKLTGVISVRDILRYLSTEIGAA